MRNNSPEPPLPSSATPSPEPALSNKRVSPVRITESPVRPMSKVSMSRPGWLPPDLLLLPFMTLPARLVASLMRMRTGLLLLCTSTKSSQRPSLQRKGLEARFCGGTPSWASPSQAMKVSSPLSSLPTLRPSMVNSGETPLVKPPPPPVEPCSSRAKKPSDNTRSRFTASVGDCHMSTKDQPPNFASQVRGWLLQSPGDKLTSLMS